MLDPEKAAEGVIKSVKEYVGRSVVPLTVKIDGIDEKIEAVAKRVAESTETIAQAVSVAVDPLAKEMGVLEARLTDASHAAIAKATEPFTLKMVEVDARLAEAANTERFRPFLETALDAVRKEGGTVDEKLSGIEKRLEAAGYENVTGAIKPLSEQIDGLHQRLDDVAKSVPTDPRDAIDRLNASVESTIAKIEEVAKHAETVSGEKVASAVAPLVDRIKELQTRLHDVAQSIPADRGEEITAATEAFRQALDETASVRKRIDDIDPRLERAVNDAIEAVKPLAERFKNIEAANDSLPAQILKLVDGRIEEAFERLPVSKDGKDGEPGKDAEPVDVDRIIKEVVAIIPVPKDGYDGKDADPVDPEMVRAEVAKAVSEIPKPKDIDPEAVAGMVADEVQKAVAAIPVPKDGKDGLAGKDAEPVDVAQIIADVVARIPPPKDGERGPAGESIVGPKGDSGERGEKGESIVGERGEKGDTGPSAYQFAVEEGFAGTKSQWLSSLVGKSGDPGRDGKDGRDALAPRDGKDGEPGRDAAQIEVLPMIDTSKSVPRGTFASHKGGLWRAARNTDPGDDLHLCGWQPIVEGFPEIEINQSEDFRTFTLRAVSSTGRTMAKSFVIPVLIDRGVYKADEPYGLGDVVSYGGSMWIAKAETTDTPGNSDAWRLSVKHGRNGKDGELLPPKLPQQVRLK